MTISAPENMGPSEEDGHDHLTLGSPGPLNKHCQAPPALNATLSCTLRIPLQLAPAPHMPAVPGPGAASSQSSLVLLPSLLCILEATAPVYSPSSMLTSQGNLDMTSSSRVCVPYPRTFETASTNKCGTSQPLRLGLRRQYSVTSAKWQGRECQGPVPLEIHGKKQAKIVRINIVRTLKRSSRFSAIKQMLNQGKVTLTR